MRYCKKNDRCRGWTILITTSDYGQGTFHFAKDKPLTLMNGANLLYLVGKHGKKARIDLKKAKKAT
jgi:restriction system protein